MSVQPRLPLYQMPLIYALILLPFTYLHLLTIFTSTFSAIESSLNFVK
jgi:hypothetical protein